MTTAEKLGLPGWLSWVVAGGFVMTNLAVLAYIYGGMALLRLLEEQKRLPLWNGQWKGFFPGDFGLALFYACCVVMAQRMPGGSWHPPLWLATLLGLIVGLGLFFFQVGEAEKADLWRFFGPTRIWHQVFIWGGGIFLFVAVCLPALVSVATGRQPLPILLVVGAGIGLVWWLSWMTYAAKHPPVELPHRPIHSRWLFAPPLH